MQPPCLRGPPVPLPRQLKALEPSRVVLNRVKVLGAVRRRHLKEIHAFVLYHVYRYIRSVISFVGELHPIPNFQQWYVESVRLYDFEGEPIRLTVWAFQTHSAPQPKKVGGIKKSNAWFVGAEKKAALPSTPFPSTSAALGPRRIFPSTLPDGGGLACTEIRGRSTTTHHLTLRSKAKKLLKSTFSITCRSALFFSFSLA